MAMTIERRNELVNRLIEIRDALYLHMSGNLRERQAMVKEEVELKRTYFRELPTVGISRCPHCGEVVSVGADFYGLNGPFWHPLQYDAVKSACEHLVTYQGAMHYNGHVPDINETSNYTEILSGPEVPFVVRRLMECDGMKLVFSCFRIVEERYTVYLMSYFCDPRPPDDKKTANWPTLYYHPDRPLSLTDDAWDYNIIGWVRKQTETLGWIEPNDSGLTIHWDWTGSPYLYVKGRRNPIRIYHGEMMELPPPKGTEHGVLQ